MSPYLSNISTKPYLPSLALNADSIDVNGETIVLRDLRFLKYRNRHTVKANIQLDYKKLKLGFQYRFRSYGHAW